MLTAAATDTPPGLLEGTRSGWYLIAANSRVEVGPFADEDTAARAARWLEDRGLGVYPSPWSPRFSRTGLAVGSRWRPARPARQRTV